MSHDHESLTLTRSLAARVKAVRKRRGWSAGQLAEQMTAHGFPWDRFTVQNLENGRRRSVTLDEVGALARVLGVAPLHLILPIDDDQQGVEIDPGKAYPAFLVREWFAGQRALGADPRIYGSEVPLLENHREAIAGGGDGFWTLLRDEQGRQMFDDAGWRIDHGEANHGDR
jgi:transcriptional regulator with XRE-family HTH domain